MDENPYEAPLGSSSFPRSSMLWLPWVTLTVGILLATGGFAAWIWGFDLGMKAFDRGEPANPLSNLLFEKIGPVLFISGDIVAFCAAVVLLCRILCSTAKQIPVEPA